MNVSPNTTNTPMSPSNSSAMSPQIVSTSDQGDHHHHQHHQQDWTAPRSNSCSAASGLGRRSAVTRNATSTTVLPPPGAHTRHPITISNSCSSSTTTAYTATTSTSSQVTSPLIIDSTSGVGSSSGVGVSSSSSGAPPSATTGQSHSAGVSSCLPPPAPRHSPRPFTINFGSVGSRPNLLHLPGLKRSPSNASTESSVASRSTATNSNSGSFSSLFAFYESRQVSDNMASNDHKYKAYVAAIDKALKSFEYTSEWADLVSALSKLNRVLTNNSDRYHVIPRRFIVGQRLAQCMHPLLPSGVHLKALETYDLIFKAIGQEHLLAELTIYSNGLFPLLSYAAINVRPAVLDLYERHVVPLGERLKPALDGFLVGLLHCLEEGSEFFERTDKLLLQVASGVGVSFFYSAIWRIIMLNSSVRLPAITFVTLHFNKKRPLTEQAHLLGLCMQTLVRAICAALLDTNILVQRAILDLLITVFPLHFNLKNEMEQAMSSPSHFPSGGDPEKSPNKITGPFSSNLTIHRKYFKRTELVAIITAALTVLLRRDLSLNRRLSAWFFGSDSSGGGGSSTNSNSNSGTVSSAPSVSSLAQPVFQKPTSFNYHASQEGVPSSNSNSSEAKARRKKTAYFESYARDLVVEAFKRCITSPVSAIPSILPPSAITNSFISFTLPLATMGPQGASASSSPATSTSSLLQLNTLHRNTSMHNNSARALSYYSQTSLTESSYSTSSTFWPYRLLICILDQREIAAPILDALCIDILRGLFHEFELLTTVVPPPQAVSSTSCESGKKHHMKLKRDSDSEGEISFNRARNLDISSSSSSDDEMDEDLSESKTLKSKRIVRRKTSGGSAKHQSQISASSPNVEVIEPTGTVEATPHKLAGDEADDEDEENSPKMERRTSKTTEEEGEETDQVDQGSGLVIEDTKPIDGKFKHSSEDEDDEEGFGVKKNALFSNIRKNITIKSQTMMRKLRRDAKGPNEEPENKMKTVMKTLPLVRQLRQKLLKMEKKNQLRMAMEAGNEDNLTSSTTPTQLTRDYDRASGRNSVLEDRIFDDDSVFLLPHQHYYYNPYYQQLNKHQRRELLKELDRVMHLLFTNVGVDFIWAKLAFIFQNAAEETIALKKLLHLIVKKARHNRPGDLENFLLGQNLEDEESECDDLLSDSSTGSMSNEMETETDTMSHTSSLNWARNLAHSLLTEFIRDSASSDSDSASSTPYASPRICSPHVSSSPPHSATSLKNRLLVGLANRCRQCGQLLSFNSPVQPVGTESISILEACTLVRFMLGDSRPYHLAKSIDAEEDPFGDNSTSAMMTNSVSVSMKRCSALEPLTVDSTNYHFLVQFLDHALHLMSQSAKSFTPVDLRASVELCLALCAKLKPAIMQTFVQRYRYASSDIKNGTDANRKPSITSWYSVGKRKTRSSSTTSSKKHLELVKEEENEEDDFDEKQQAPVVNQTEDIDKEDETDGEKFSEINDDLKIDIVAAGVLHFFEVFVESILVKPRTNDNQVHEQSSGKSKLSLAAQQMIHFYHSVLSASATASRQHRHFTYLHSLFLQQDIQQWSAISIRHQLLPIYEQLCELLVEMGTMPLLTSPAFIFKRSPTTMLKQSVFDESLASSHRWLLYLMVLSANRLSTCAHMHHQNASGGRIHKRAEYKQPNANIVYNANCTSITYTCCYLRQIAFTSLTTLLDLLTVARAYVVSQNASLNVAHHPLIDDEVRMPSFGEMSLHDLFPDTFMARRLNFYPLVHPRLLQHISGETCWFRLIAVRLWSNLSPEDSTIHYATTALLQQLHSISTDSSTCEAVICDEMMGISQQYAHHLRPTSLTFSSMTQYQSLMSDVDKIYQARSKFILMFSIIRDIRFLSERLALVVTALSSAAKSDLEHEHDSHSIDFDPSRNEQTIVSGKLNLSFDLDSLDVHVDLAGASASELDTVLRLTSPCSPIALCTTLKRHFDRPLFIMLDALSHRRTLSEHQAAAADWLYRCLSPADALAARNTMANSVLFSSDGNKSGSSDTKPELSLATAINSGSDIGRLLEPLLFILLHPSTCRLSVKNVSIHRYNRLSHCLHQPAGSAGETLDQMVQQLSTHRQEEEQCNSLLSEVEDQIDESKIYAISSTNGNVIYHVRRKPPRSNPDSCESSVCESTHQSPPSARHMTMMMTSSTPNGQKVVSEVVPTHSPLTNLQHRLASDLKMKMVLNPFELDPNVAMSEINWEMNEMESNKAVIDEVVRDVVSDLIQSVVTMLESEEEQQSGRKRSDSVSSRTSSSQHFPGMAFLSRDKDTNSLNGASFDSKFTQLQVSHMHRHILLYERQYDSVRTIYALDTILNMIETWPSRVLYAMATTTLLSSHSLNDIFDGTRGSQIQSLFMRHRNSIQGRGFYYDVATNKVTKSSNKLDGSKSNANSLLQNISLLELITQICLQYMRSYYPSCPTNQTGGTKDQSATELDNVMVTNQSCVDLDTVYGNQRVRLMAAQVLRVIFAHLSSMLESSGHAASSSSSRHSRKHQSIESSSPLTGFQLRPFAQYLHDMILRCEVQRNVLQCLVTSVWHYQQKARLSMQDKEHEQAKARISEGYLYPPMESNQEADPGANIFIREILDYNDYPARSLHLNSRPPSANQLEPELDEGELDGFHDEFEKSLLRLTEQVMILECRIYSTLSPGGINDLSPYYRMPRSPLELHEMRFEPNVPLAGQALLQGAIGHALQQSYRRRVHPSWLAFIETSLAFSGKFLSRLVQNVTSQLCRNLEWVTKQVSIVSISDEFAHVPDIPPFTAKYIQVLLQGITMIFAHCLVDRTQFDQLLPFLSEILEESENELALTFGLSANRHRKKANRPDTDLFGIDPNALAGSVANGTTSGPMQMISSIFHNFMVVPSISSSNGTANASNNNSTSGQPSDGYGSDNEEAPALLEARRTLLSNMDRILTALFNAWCSLVVVEQIEGDDYAGEDLHPSSSCCHYFHRFQGARSPSGSNVASQKLRFKHSNCCLGWSSTAYTGWYIMGSPAVIRRSILTILSVTSVAHYSTLMKSVAHVWHDLRDRNQENKVGLVNGAIDVVITPVTSQQRQLVRLISSLSSIISFETLIQTVRVILKSVPSSQASSVGQELSLHGYTCNPFDNIFLVEIAILEFFLAYIRTCSGTLLLNSWRSMLALIKDGLAMNLTASVPCETFWPRQQRSPGQSVSINFQPLVNFHLMAILHEFVIAAPFVEERRAQKELQEVAQKLIEANIGVAGGRLLQSRWTFRRNFEVLPVNSMLSSENSSTRSSPNPSPKPERHSTGNNMTEEALASSHETQVAMKRNLFRSSASISFPRSSMQTTSSETSEAMSESTVLSKSTLKSNQEGLFFGLFSFNLSNNFIGYNTNDLTQSSQTLFYSFFCIKTLYALSEYAAPILDVVYASEEKEKMIPLITNLMSYVVPYLRSHTHHNLPCFDACSRLLASLSGYQYTRKAWRRESLDLLLDGTFFQMPAECLPAWRTIIDHLMSHDKNTFREFLNRMSLAQSPSTALKIFVPSATIRDQETESKAQLVKRLAFVLFCSEKDQYQKYMAEIQEKLIELHRTSQSPLVQSQVLLAFRVIILRMSPHHLASLWPFIYTEMFQVFLSIEQILLDFIRNNETRSMTTESSTQLDSLSSGNQLDSLQSESVSIASKQRLEPKIASAQLQLFLNACKLLDLAMLLPSDTLPQFQMHRWAFISDTLSASMPTFDIASLFGFENNGSSSSAGGSIRSTAGSLPTDILSFFTSDDQPSSFLSFSEGDTGSETTSINSTSTHDLCSLPSTLSSQTRSGSQQQNTTFVPHIIFINSILNYLTDNPPSTMLNCSTMSPLLTMSSIESIHDLHFFFHSLLWRASQGSMQSSPAASVSLAQPGPKAPKVQRRSQQATNRVKSKKSSTSGSKENAFRRKSSTRTRNRSAQVPCSLEELFLNIDRIIAHDFLEPLLEKVE